MKNQKHNEAVKKLRNTITCMKENKNLIHGILIFCILLQAFTLAYARNGMVEFQENLEPEIVEVVKTETVYVEAPRPEFDEEAEYIARVLYGIRSNDSEDLRKVIWVILNRVDSQLYPNSVIEVCKQPKQWVAYYDDNPVLEELYDMALTELESWRNNEHRPLALDFLWFDWSPSEIQFKTKF